jgi:hypothetical protein
VGDTVIVRQGLGRMTPAGTACRIVGILPADHGETQYRVRFGSETFDRRIAASDIETVQSAVKDGPAPSPDRNGAWLKPLSIRTGK